MTPPSTSGSTTRVAKVIRAPRMAVYHAFLDRDAVTAWLPPATMKGRVHVFEPHVGGRIHLTLTYQRPEDARRGKTSGNTDTVRGHFVELVPFQRIVEVVEFDSPDPALAGEMRITASLVDSDEGTEVTMLCEDIPEGVRPEDHEAGCRSSLDNLAALIE